DENVEWYVQALRHFISNRHAAPRQTEYDYVVAPSVLFEFLRHLSASFCSIWESSLHAAQRAALSNRSGRGKQRLHAIILYQRHQRSTRMKMLPYSPFEFAVPMYRRRDFDLARAGAMASRNASSL